MIAWLYPLRKRTKFFTMLIVISGLLLIGIAGCSLLSDSNSGRPASSEVENVQSLTSDQESIEKLRQNIPQSVREENDQLKEILNLMGEMSEPPSRIRERFNQKTRRMRQDFQRSSQRTREEFNLKEKKEQEDLFSSLKKERDKFNRKKSDRETKKRFYDEQETKRKSFSADSRERRNRFNMDLKIKSDDFQQMMRDRNYEFDQAFKDYSVKYKEHLKQKNEKSSNDKATSPFSIGPTPLKTGNGSDKQ